MCVDGQAQRKTSYEEVFIIYLIYFDIACAGFVVAQCALKLELVSVVATALLRQAHLCSDKKGRALNRIHKRESSSV